MAMKQHGRTMLRWMRRGGVVAVLLAVLAGLLLPASVGAGLPTNGPGIVYFPVTGHNVNGDILEFWHENGGLDRLGNPVTEEIKDNGRVKQYFERGVVEYTPTVGLAFGRIGADLAAGRRDGAFRPLSRDEWGTDRTGRRFFPEVGHGIAGTFAQFWDQNGSLTTFGYPLSEPLRETVGDANQMTTVQYFERARMELVIGAGGAESVRLSTLGKEIAIKLNGGMIPAPKNGSALEYTTALWPKWIDVNLTTQRLTAYEGNTQFLTYLTTSGKPGNETPTGTFEIFHKVKSERMRGDIGLPTQYDIKNVPWTMYFAGGGYAIHGAPWRSVYGPGTQLDGSHGCVNSPVDQVATLYQWAPLGTTVVVHF